MLGRTTCRLRRHTRPSCRIALHPLAFSFFIFSVPLFFVAPASEKELSGKDAIAPIITGSALQRRPLVTSRAVILKKCRNWNAYQVDVTNWWRDHARLGKYGASHVPCTSRYQAQCSVAYYMPSTAFVKWKKKQTEYVICHIFVSFPPAGLPFFWFNSLGPR